MVLNVEQALHILKDKGFKYTGKREEIIRIFAQEKRYLSAREILQQMQQAYPTLSFDTIYRNLTLFTDLSILETTELGGERKFRFQCTRDGHHHHHLICLSCGKTENIPDCPYEDRLKELPGFKITGHKFEVYGYCSDCENGKSPTV